MSVTRPCDCLTCKRKTPHSLQLHRSGEYMPRCGICGTWTARTKWAPVKRGKKPQARKSNPVPASSRLDQIETASRLYENFSGHDAEEMGYVDKPQIPDVLVGIGECDGILYSTVRDGKLEKYIHKFKKSARPLFAVAPDGSTLFLIGGNFDFTERGIVDR